MITVDVIYNDNNIKQGFVVSGHAEYAEPGEDIVCAAVSALVFTTINSLDSLLASDINLSVDEETGLISVIFRNPLSHDEELLFNSMLLGLIDIEKNYGDEFLKVKVSEVEKWWN